MKMKLTRRIVASFLAITTVLLFSISLIKAEDAHKSHDTHDHGDHMTVNDKVRCAVDGMMMKASAMIKVEQDGKAYYFCNDAQAEMFKANPDKFLQTISVGNLTFNLNVLTMDEYKGMMSHMGMEGMIKTDEIKGKTHYFSVYPTQDHEEIALDDIKLALQITNTEGETKMALLKYSKMMRTYEGFIAMPKGEDSEVRIRVTSQAAKIRL
jgi:YHS domain-containing protein